MGPQLSKQPPPLLSWLHGPAAVPDGGAFYAGSFAYGMFMNPLIAAAMAACLRLAGGGAFDHGLDACDRIAIAYNDEVETLPTQRAPFPAFQETPSRQADLATVKNAVATLP